MATAKKTTKKTTSRAASARKATPVKKTVTKKAPVKRTVAKKSPVKRASRSASSKTVMRSFHVAADQPPFTTFKITRQTLYWVVLVAFIVFAQLWIISLQVEVAMLLDAQQAQLQDM